MAEYIDRSALGIGKAKREAFTIPEYADGWNEAIKIIDNALTVDAVPVVRCKDRKHRYSDSWCEYVDDDNFYCAIGERKEGAD